MFVICEDIIFYRFVVVVLLSLGDGEVRDLLLITLPENEVDNCERRMRWITAKAVNSRASCCFRAALAAYIGAQKVLRFSSVTVADEELVLQEGLV